MPPASTADASSAWPIAVIGGGATGLAAAYRLAKNGHAVRLFEAGPRLGGAVQSEQRDGWLIETGPNSFLENSKEIVDLIKELGLTEARLAANSSAKKRFIVRGGKVHAVPMSPGAFLTTPLFSFGSKLRILTELLRKPRRRVGDMSLSQFVEDHFGQEIVDYAVNPFVTGVYAGDVRKLSTRHAFPKWWEAEQHHGSLIRGLQAQAKVRRSDGHPKTTIISFRSGLQQITDALAARIPAGSIELGARIESLLPGKPWSLVWSRGGETRTEMFSAVVLASPAAALAHLTFGSLGEKPLACLDGIEYPPVASLFLGYRRDRVAHPLDGFGVLVPSVERRPVLGVLFSSTLFPGRAPDGHIALTVMIGGTSRPDLTHDSLNVLLGKIRPDLEHLLGVRGDPVFKNLHVWPRAIPQYQLGYERFLDAIDKAEEAYPGLVVAGHVKDGISLPNCLLSGLTAAAHATAKSSSAGARTARSV